MSNISFTEITDGSNIDASDVNGPLNTIYDDYNGNIDSNNLATNAVTTAKITDANVTVPKLSNPYKARAFANTDQTINDKTATAITFGAESYDTNNNFATNAYTVPVTGWYQINLQATITCIAKIAVATLYAYSDATIIGVASNAQGTALDSIVTLGYADSVYLTAGKVITVKALCDTSDGSTAVINGSAAGFQTFISIHLLSV
jgi:hypothetical protein